MPPAIEAWNAAGVYQKAIALMVAQPSMIKRPVLDLGGKLLVGFKPEIYAKEVAPSGGSRRGKSG